MSKAGVSIAGSGGSRLGKIFHTLQVIIAFIVFISIANSAILPADRACHIKIVNALEYV